MFEECSCEESKEELGYNLIAIEFTDSPFQTEKKTEKYKVNQHYGYVVDITDNAICEIYLLISGLGWGETEIIEKGTSEYTFVEQD